MGERTANIGLSLGADICWPIAYESLLAALDLDLKIGGDRVRFACERVTIEPFDLRQPVKYDVVIDRLTHWYSISREWIKKAIVLNDLYVYNNPWSIQANEKHTSYCAMMRLGLPIPETWMLPAKAYEHADDLEPTLRQYARMFSLEGDRRQDRLPVLHEALPRRRLARRDEDRRPRELPPRLRQERHRPDEPAEGGDPLRLVRALHRPRPADAQGQLRPGGGAARPLHDGHELPHARRTRRPSRT